MLHDLFRLKEVRIRLPIRLNKTIDAEVQIGRGVFAPEIRTKGPNLLAVLLGLQPLIDPVPNKAAL